MTSTTEPRFTDGDEVFDRARKWGLGRVRGEAKSIGGEWHYDVRLASGRSRRFPERSLEPKQEADESLEQLVLAGRFGSLAAFQRALSVARIRKEADNRTTVYSFNAQRVQFQPHQYKPLLRFLDSEDRRLLIADEVGLGKTIEAGLILAEMEARQSPAKVLVVCPSRLTEKWWEELNGKFAQDFRVWRAQDVRNYARIVSRNPHQTRMRAILSMQSLRREDVYNMLTDAAGNIDLLIVDEAHHARNKGTQTYTSIDKLAELSSAVLFLSATPIHLGSQDLFNQLHILRPKEFQQPVVFAMALQRNEGVVRALARVRTRNPEELPAAAEDIEGAFRGSLFQDSSVALVKEAADRLRGPAPANLRQWLDLERDVERLHYLSNILTRTRKREVQEFAAQRRGHVLKVCWSPQEQELFMRLTRRKQRLPWPESHTSLGMIQRERMAASSLIGSIAYRESGKELEDLRADLFDDDELEDDDAEPLELDMAAVLAMPDAKLEKLLEILTKISQENPQAKVLVFTYFVGTSRYLEESLNRRGLPALRIAGDVPSTPGRPDSDERNKRVRAFREDPSIRVLISTEVGSEGLDFQFCSSIVNYDLPWNPMTVEQRIGRIDRFGQKAAVLQIWNLVVENTIEERILIRLYQRIGIFERSIGPLEQILGEKVAELRKDYFDGRLRPEEADQRLEQTAAAIEARKLEMEELDKQAEKLFGHEDYIRSQLERVRRLGRYVTPSGILTVLQGFLYRSFGQLQVVDEGGGIYSVRVTDALKQMVISHLVGRNSEVFPRKDFTREGRYWFAVEGSVAYDHPNVDLLNASHPLMTTALEVLEELLEDPVNRTGAGRVPIPAEDQAIPQGTYLVASFRVHITGIKERTLIETSALKADDGSILDPELAERLLHLAHVHGEDISPQHRQRASPEGHWNTLMEDITRRVQAIRTREFKENALLVARRHEQAQEEYNRESSIADRMEWTALSGGNLDRVKPLAEKRREDAQARLDAELARISNGSRPDASFETDPVAVVLVETYWP